MPVDPPDPMDLIRRLDARAEELRAQSQQITESLAAAAATEENSCLSVTVSPTGVIEELTFLPAATRASEAQLATAVKDAYTAAAAAAANNTADLLRGSGMSEAVIASLPDDIAARQKER